MKIIKRTPTVPGVPKASDLWRTNPALYAALHAEFAFDLDCAADADNHLCDRWLGPSGLVEDALTVDAGAHGRRGYLNCPYSTEIIKAFMPWAAGQTFTATPLDVLVCLTPNDPSAKWWEHTRRAVEIRDIPHRLAFGKADGVGKTTAMFPGAVVVFRPQPGIVRAQPRRVVWTYRKSEV